MLQLQLIYRSNVPTDRLLALSWQELLRSRLGDCLVLDLKGVESTTAYRSWAMAPSSRSCWIGWGTTPMPTTT